ncbi:MAG: creatininase family protein [Clostridium sp.]
MVGPCLEVGQSKSLTSFPGTIAISAETLKAVYSEIIAEFVRLGFKSFFIVNNHLHNTQPLNEVLEDARIKFGIKYAQVGVWQYLPAVSDKTGMWDTPAPHAHASEAQTSVLMYLYPELVGYVQSSELSEQISGQVASNHEERSVCRYDRHRYAKCR